MVGRLYTWRGAVWIIVCRGQPFDAGPRRNVLLERVVLWTGIGWGDQWQQSIDGTWYRPDAATYKGERAERVVRPFRGLPRHR